MLAIIETHPIQYHAPVYRALQSTFGVPVTAIYGSDFSVQGYRDQEFGATFAWDTDLLSGYRPFFLSRVAEGGARAFEDVSARGLARALRQVAPTATMVCGYSPRFHQVALVEAWRARRPILFRAETTDHAEVRTDLKSWARDRALRTIYARCARLLYVGQNSLQHFKRLACPEEKLVFSPYCVDTTAFAGDETSRTQLRQATRERLGIGPQQRVILFSGKLSPRKGPDLLLDAVKQLPPDERAATVVLFLGSGEMQDELREQARREPAVEVIFAGFQNQTRLSAYYHAADMLVLPSRHSETWGLVVNEALFHGLPCVVATAVGCGPDLIAPGGTGEIFQADSAGDLAQALGRAAMLVGQPEVRDRCRAAVERYSVERAADGIAQAYTAVTRARAAA
jgi:glycosyltransferase involved in cell wall biosynthesis